MPTYNEAIKAIESFYTDTSYPLQETLKNLQELKDEIETMITATLEDIKHYPER